MLFLQVAGSETFCVLCKGSFLIAEVLASKGYKVQPLPRVPRFDTVQVFILVLLHVFLYEKWVSELF